VPGAAAGQGQCADLRAHEPRGGDQGLAPPGPRDAGQDEAARVRPAGPLRRAGAGGTTPRRTARSAPVADGTQGREIRISRPCSFLADGGAGEPSKARRPPGLASGGGCTRGSRALRPGSSRPPSGWLSRVSGGRVCMTSAMRVCWSLAVAAAMFVAVPGAAQGQRQEEPYRYRWYFGLRDVTFQGYVGIADHGRFLLQALDFDLVDVNPQRKLTGDRSFSWGVAVGARVLPRTQARLAFNWTRPDLEFEDDTGLDLDAFDIDDIGELTSTTLALELLRYLLPEWRRFNAYAGAGVIITWWSLDDTRLGLIVDDTLFGSIGSIVAVDDGQTRFGGSAVLGLQYRTSRRFAIRLEAATFAPGNPFSGDNSYVPITGFTIDEPSHVR